MRILPQASSEGRGEGNKAILAELGLTNGEDPGFKIDIADASMQRFADAQATAVEEAEQLRHDMRTPGCAGIRADMIRSLQQSPDLVMCENTGNKVRTRPGKKMGRRDRSGIAMTSHAHRQSTGHANPQSVGGGTFVRRLGHPAFEEIAG